MSEPAGAYARLHRLLGDEAVAWIVRRARDRLEAGRPLAGTVTLPAASAEQRRAAERLTGRAARSGTSLSVSLAEVDRILRDSGVAPGGLAEADGRAELEAWRTWLFATGVVRRLAPEPDQAKLLLSQVAMVLSRLPSRGVPIGRLAAECCGDAHALDDGRPAGTLVLSAARALAGMPFAADGAAESRRAVLCLGLPGDARTALGRMPASPARCTRWCPGSPGDMTALPTRLVQRSTLRTGRQPVRWC